MEEKVVGLTAWKALLLLVDRLFDVLTAVALPVVLLVFVTLLVGLLEDSVRLVDA